MLKALLELDGGGYVRSISTLRPSPLCNRNERMNATSSPLHGVLVTSCCVIGYFSIRILNWWYLYCYHSIWLNKSLIAKQDSIYRYPNLKMPWLQSSYFAPFQMLLSSQIDLLFCDSKCRTTSRREKIEEK